ncbi:restriction endonuclease subunit R, partial [Chloroflexota bacterium]
MLLFLYHSDYFGVINIGDVSAFKKLLRESGLEVKTDNVTPSLFERINEPNSNVSILIGAKKFIEGWDSWRVSSMGLINMGKGEGPQIIQLFGRGVRLKGKAFSLKRSDENKYQVKGLETLNIFGLNADYINRFLEAIRKESVEYEEIDLPIKLMDVKEKWNSLYILQTPGDFDFNKQFLKLEIDKDLLCRVKIDITPRVKLAHGLETAKAETGLNKAHLDGSILDLLDWDRIFLDLLRYRTVRGYTNLAIGRSTLQEIVKGDGYELCAFPEQVVPMSFADLAKLEEIVLIILKNYIDRFYSFKLRQEETRKLVPTHLIKEDPNLTYNSYTLKIPRDKKDEIKKIKELVKAVDKLYQTDLSEIPTIHFDRHLYAPLVVYSKKRDFIKSVPPKLNEGETEFIERLREYLKTNQAEIKGSEIFLLRNLSQRGIRFFQTSGFYPDFIMWIRKGAKQTIVFIDPKGIRNSGNFSDEKIQLHKDIKAIEAKIKTPPELRLESYILSVSKYQDINKTFDVGKQPK